MSEQFRICKQCNIEKAITEFTYYKRIDKYSHTCKECKNRKKRESGYHQEYYKKHKYKIKAKVQKYYQENKEHVQEYKIEYRIKNQEKIKERKARYYQENKEMLSQKFKKYYQENAEHLKQYQKDYLSNEDNKDKRRKTHRIYKNNKIKNDELFKLKEQLRNMIRWSFYRKGKRKKCRTLDIIGCDYDTFYYHLLKTFKDNYGYEWDGQEPVHIDHITPIAQASTEEEIIKLCHYKNLQLLKAKDNIEKRDKTDYVISDKEE